MIGELIKNYREELGYSVTQLARIVGVQRSTVVNWEKGLTKPSPLSIAKVSRALGWKSGVRENLLRANQSKGGKRIKLTDEFYVILHELEGEFGSCTHIPEDDPRLHQLRLMLEVDTLESHGYDKKKVEKLRIKNNVSRRDLSIAVGRGVGWFTGTFLKGSKVFTKSEAEMFADFFEVEVEVFEE